MNFEEVELQCSWKHPPHHEKTKTLLPVPPTKPLMVNTPQTENINIYKKEQEVFKSFVFKSFKASYNNSAQYLISLELKFSLCLIQIAF